MRRNTVVALAIVSVLLVGTTVMSYSKYKKSESNYAQLQSENESTRQRYGAALNEIATIQDSLNAIVLGDESVQAIHASGQAEVETQGTVHDQVLTRISMLKSAIERTKERITDLDKRLKKNGVKMAGMEKMIASLRKSVAEKEDRIALLSTQVDTLQTQVSGLTVTVEQKQQEITDKQREIATVFYAVGTKKELTRSGVVQSKGGVLGLGKTLKPSGTFVETAFTPLDTDQENVIRIPSDKAQVLSAQPVSSYVLQPVGKDMVELRILDPKEFRKIKQVVILMT
jgi:predicted RNase H-like nuclease (RuvC/YqgF family)